MQVARAVGGFAQELLQVLVTLHLLAQGADHQDARMAGDLRLIPVSGDDGRADDEVAVMDDAIL